MRSLAARNIFLTAFLLVNLIGVIRYIFQFGEPLSSPEYSSTPRYFFFFWDVLICIIIGVLIFNARKAGQTYFDFLKVQIGSKDSFSQRFFRVLVAGKYLAIYALAAIFAVICLFQAKSFYVVGAARAIILYGFIFVVITFNSKWIIVAKLNKLIEFLAFFGLFFVILQIVLYNKFGILPAHSHRCQLIRYGSFYNDSLVFGIMLPMFAGYYFKKYSNIYLHLLVAAIFFALAFLSGGLTAIAISIIYIGWTFRNQYTILLLLGCIAVLLVTLFHVQLMHLWAFKNGYGNGCGVSDILQPRHFSFVNGSIGGHLEGWSHLKNVKWINLLGFAPLDYLAESGLLSLIYNFGIPVFAVVILLHIQTLRACHNIFIASENRDVLALAGATEGLTFSVLLASINLPVIVYPPVFLWVVTLSAIIIAGRGQFTLAGLNKNLNNITK